MTRAKVKDSTAITDGLTVERRIDELIAGLPPLSDEDRRQATAILASVPRRAHILSQQNAREAPVALPSLGGADAA